MSTQTLQRSSDLPQFNVTRALLYDLIETMVPLTAITDDESLTVFGDKIRAAAALPFWRKYTVKHDDFTAEATTDSAALFTLPAGGVIHAVKLRHGEAFAGGAISAYTLSVGIADAETKYLDAVDVLTAPGDNVLTVSDKNVQGETHDAEGTEIRVFATATDDDVADAETGEADIWVLWSAIT